MLNVGWRVGVLPCDPYTPLWSCLSINTLFSPTVVFPGPSRSLKHTDPCTLGPDRVKAVARQEEAGGSQRGGQQGPLLPSASRQPWLSPQLPALLKLTTHGLASGDAPLCGMAATCPRREALPWAGAETR